MFVDNSITLFTKNSTCTLLPSRGGIVYSLIFNDEEILYQDQLDDTLLSQEKNVRGGIPIMFPQAGSLTEAEQKELGYTSPQHGFLRNTELSVINKGDIMWFYNMTKN